MKSFCLCSDALRVVSTACSTWYKVERFSSLTYKMNKYQFLDQYYRKFNSNVGQCLVNQLIVLDANQLKYALKQNFPRIKWTRKDYTLIQSILKNLAKEFACLQCQQNKFKCQTHYSPQSPTGSDNELD